MDEGVHERLIDHDHEVCEERVETELRRVCQFAQLHPIAWMFKLLP